jgi:hypothetical protein
MYNTFLIMYVLLLLSVVVSYEASALTVSFPGYGGPMGLGDGLAVLGIGPDLGRQLRMEHIDHEPGHVQLSSQAMQSRHSSVQKVTLSVGISLSVMS